MRVRSACHNAENRVVPSLGEMSKVDARGVDAVADEGFVLLVSEGEVTELVERVGGVGDELAKEDLGV
jgi:hypothetical protein